MARLGCTLRNLSTIFRNGATSTPNARCSVPRACSSVKRWRLEPDQAFRSKGSYPMEPPPMIPTRVFLSIGCPLGVPTLWLRTSGIASCRLVGCLESHRRPVLLPLAQQHHAAREKVAAGDDGRLGRD